MTTAILTDPRYINHTNPSHVERAERLNAINKAIQESNLSPDLLSLSARAATDMELSAAHAPSYLESLRHYSEQGGGELDADTYMTGDSWEAAVWAAGGTMQLVESIVQGTCHNGFALVRPPGHHATQKRAMGFCLINNVAVAAHYALSTLGMERVAIVDYDVHHGNGTQDIFYNDSRVLYCSTHASPFYPGTGMADEVGEGAGRGATLNLPLPLGLGDKGHARAYEQVIVPALQRWKPDIILVSAGYDAHWSDPIGHMILSITGFATITQMLSQAAGELCQGRIALVLEGGYNLDAIGAGVVASLRVLMGRPPEKDGLGVIDAPEPDIHGVISSLTSRHPLLT